MGSSISVSRGETRGGCSGGGIDWGCSYVRALATNFTGDRSGGAPYDRRLHRSRRPKSSFHSPSTKPRRSRNGSALVMDTIGWRTRSTPGLPARFLPPSRQNGSLYVRKAGDRRIPHRPGSISQRHHVVSLLFETRELHVPGDHYAGHGQLLREDTFVVVLPKTGTKGNGLTRLQPGPAGRGVHCVLWPRDSRHLL
jgi:hypothetical protein